MHRVEGWCGMDPTGLEAQAKGRIVYPRQESNLSLGTAMPISIWHAAFTSTGLCENVNNKKRGISWLAKRPRVINCLVRWQWIRRGNKLSSVSDSQPYTFNLTCSFMPRIPTRILILCRSAYTGSSNSVNWRP